jgi:hypothetical protein
MWGAGVATNLAEQTYLMVWPQKEVRQSFQSRASNPAVGLIIASFDVDTLDAMPCQSGF